MNVTKKKDLPFVVLVVCLIVTVSSNIPPSYGHALVNKSDPAPGLSIASPPSSITITFSDPVDIHYSKIKVLDSNGNEVDNKDDHYIGSDQSTLAVTLPANLPNGVYTVSTKVLDQTDGHVTEDAFVFGVGEEVPKSAAASPTTSISDVISFPFALARFPALLGQVMVVGASFLSIWIWKPFRKIPWLEDALSRTRPRIEMNTAKMVLVGAIVLVGSDFAMIAAEAISINASLPDTILTKFGQSWIIRLALSSALAGIAGIWYYKQKIDQAMPNIRWKWLTFSLGIGILITDTMISHAAATGLALPPLLDFVHDIAASFWIGGLVFAAFAVLPALKNSQDHIVRLSSISLMIPRFTVLIVAILGVVAVTGPTLLYTLESNFSLTLVSTYGKILVVKLSLAAAMVALGGYHEVATRSKALSKLRSASVNGDMMHIAEDSRRMESRFHRNITIEALVGVALIASVALLVNSGLPATEYQNQLQQTALSSSAITEKKNTYIETSYAQDGERVVLTIDPYYSGTNNLSIRFLDSHGSSTPMQSARLTYTQVDKGLGPIVENLQPTSQGLFSSSTNTFAIAGHWNLQVEGVQSASNSLNIIGSFNDLYLSPKTNAISASIQQFSIPENNSTPLFPVYDKIRNTVWIGDTLNKSGRIFAFDLGSKKFTEHSLSGVNDVSLMSLDNLDGTLWYIDPLGKQLGNYNPDSHANNMYKVPTPPGGLLTGLAVDGSGNAWIAVSTLSGPAELLKFDASNKSFTTTALPENSQPQGLAVDESSGHIWIAESNLGKIARFDPAANSIVEYPQGNGTLATPTAILVDPLTGRVYVSEHDGKEVSAFDPILGTFSKYPLDPSQQNLPYGMVFDNDHNLWVAEHTLDKISVVNPRTGETNEFPIPTTGSLTQHITADTQGDIILVEQGSHSIGILTTTAGAAAGTSVLSSLPFEYPGTSLGIIAGPSIAASIIVLAFFYVKSAKDMDDTASLISSLSRKRTRSAPIA